jgi:hypothetical protein
MKKKFKSRLTGILAAAAAALTMAARAESLTLNPTADAFVATGTNGNLSNDNFGSAGALAIAAPGLSKGEFQTVMKFDLSGAATTFNAEFGTGQWTIQSVVLQLISSVHPNSIFNAVAAGQFDVSLMQDNAWLEGTGTGGKPTTDGISYNALKGTFINDSADQALGTFSFPGDSGNTNSYALDLTPGIITDTMNGGDMSLRLYAADSTVSYLFSARETAGSEPALVITVVPEPAGAGLWVMGAMALVIGRTARRAAKRPRREGRAAS